MDSINDQEVCIRERILESKIVRKNHPIQCNSRVIACVEQCVEGVQMLVALFYELVGRGCDGSKGRRTSVYLKLVVDLNHTRGLDGANKLSRHGCRSGESVQRCTLSKSLVGQGTYKTGGLCDPILGLLGSATGGSCKIPVVF